MLFLGEVSVEGCERGQSPLSPSSSKEEELSYVLQGVSLNPAYTGASACAFANRLCADPMLVPVCWSARAQCTGLNFHTRGPLSTTGVCTYA